MKSAIILVFLAGCSTWEVNADNAVTAIFRPDYNRQVECANRPPPWIWDTPTKTCVHMTPEQQAAHFAAMAPKSGTLNLDSGSLNPGAVWTGSPIIFPTGWAQHGGNSVGRY